MSHVEKHRRYRTIWISDIHLGTRACNAEALLDFLRHTDSDTLYLVGDIVDGWRLKKGWFWPQLHNDVVQKLLRKARKGTHIVYLPGNHDEVVRPFIGNRFGTISIADEAVHQTADGRRFLVIHGDRFDAIVKYAGWLAHVGDRVYALLLSLNTGLNILRRRMGFSYWSLSAYLKHRTKKAVEFISRYEATLAEEARRRSVDGVICGHIHTAEMKDMNGVAYANTGDWVESCTALVEHESGALEILYWRLEAPGMERLPPPETTAVAA